MSISTGLSKNFSFWTVSLDLDAMFKIKSLLYKDLILNSRGCRKSNQLLRHPLAVNEAALFGCRSYTFVSVCPKVYFKAIGIFMGKLEVKRLKRFTRLLAVFLLNKKNLELTYSFFYLFCI